MRENMSRLEAPKSRRRSLEDLPWIKSLELHIVIYNAA